MRQVSMFHLRLAEQSDVPALHALIEASVRGLQAGDYTGAQIEGALGTVLGLDTQLISDRTYFVAEAADPHHGNRKVLAGCGGWSKRKTLFGADRGPGREPELLDPATDADGRAVCATEFNSHGHRFLQDRVGIFGKAMG